MARAPAVFLAHGSPMSALGGDEHAAALRRFGAEWPQLRAIVIVSAHWQRPEPVRVTSWSHMPLIYDFGGFAEELYRITYPAPGQPAVAARALELLGASGLRAEAESTRGLDHGAWVPLLLAWPEADIPVVQVSLPALDPAGIFRLGEALRPLREEGVMVVGSGGIVHNLRRIHLHDKNAAVDGWAADFDRWVAGRVAERDFGRLFGYRQEAPHAALAVPTPEHFDPLFVTLGASFEEDDLVSIYEGFHYGNLSLRSFACVLPEV